MTAGLPSDLERERLRTPPAERPVMRQIWRHLTFLHWPVAVEALAARLPPGLDVDTFEGVAYVGLVPFTIPLSRTPRAGLPIAPAFHETNLRTYVHRGGRDPGIWFFSLDAASRLAVAGARCAYRLPYFAAEMTMAVTEGAVDYASRRLSPGAPAAFRGRCRPTGPPAPAAPGSREFFLAERYLLYAWNGRALRTARVAHRPYPLQLAEASDLEESLFLAAGLPPPDGPPALVHYAHELDVQVHRPHALDTLTPPARSDR